LNKVAELRHGKLPQLEAELKRPEKKGHEQQATLFKEEVSEEEIAEVVSKWSGVPVTRPVEGEKQAPATGGGVARAGGWPARGRHASDGGDSPRAQRTGSAAAGGFLFDRRASETELAKTLAETLFDTEASMVRIDM
jgi:ATP-dependent Clp protease ATP-binding subunit ClpB